MASQTTKNDKRKKTNKESPAKKQKVDEKKPGVDLFSYGNKIDLTFGWSTKNTKTMITLDSSDDDDDSDGGGFERVSSDEENVDADDSQELLGKL